MQPDMTDWQQTRKTIREKLLGILGPFPTSKPALQVQVIDEVRCEGYVRRKITYQTQPGETIPAYLMIPDGEDKPRPAALCIHPTTRGSGKDRIAGVWGIAPGLPPDESRSYAQHLAQRGYVVIAPDFLTDGERIYPGWQPYHTRPFYEQNPEWSAVGKNIWDAMGAIDVLEETPEVDSSRIGCIGHSFGGHHSVFVGALDERVACVVSNGGVMSWYTRDEDHWARPLDSWYTYIHGLAPYVRGDAGPPPIEFHDVIALVAPRPLLAMTAEGDSQTVEETTRNYGAARAVWLGLTAPEHVGFYLYPGPHDFPLQVREMAYSWLHRWLHNPLQEV